MKRIRRNYRLHPDIDAIIKLVAKQCNTSEADALSYCVLSKAGEIVMAHRLLTKIQQGACPKELAEQLKSARRRDANQWART